MKIVYLLVLFIIAIFIFSCERNDSVAWSDYNPVEFVNPLLGVTSLNSELPAIATPSGDLRIYPRVIAADSAERSETGRTEFIYGFSHSLISNNNTSAQNNILIMPTLGDFDIDAEKRKSSYSLQVASPGHYKTKLDRYGSFAEMTLTDHTALHQYYFQDGWAHISVDLSTAPPDLRGGMIRFNGPMEIMGYTYQRNGDENERQRVWFVVQFDRTAMDGGLYENKRLMPEETAIIEGENIGAYFSFRTLEAGAIHAKIALSENSLEEAYEYLQLEQQAWSFALLRQRAREAWKNELSNILVHGGTDALKKTFYTSLYRTFLNRTKIVNDSASTGMMTTDVPAFLKEQYCKTEYNSPMANFTANDAVSGRAARTIRNAVEQYSRTPQQPAAIVWGMLGLLPSCAEDDYFVLPPLFQHSEIKLPGESSLVIDTQNFSTNASHVKKLKFDGKTQGAENLSETHLKSGGTLLLQLDNR